MHAVHLTRRAHQGAADSVVAAQIARRAGLQRLRVAKTPGLPPSRQLWGLSDAVDTLLAMAMYRNCNIRCAIMIAVMMMHSL